MRRLVAPLALLVVLAGPLSPAAAGTATPAPGAAPPGSSAVDQDRESVPQAPGRSPGRRVNPSERRALEREGGQDGRDLAAALEREGGVPTSTAPAAESEDRASGAEADAKDASGEPAKNDETSVTEGRSEDERAGGAVTTSGGTAPAEAAASSTFGTKVGPVPLWLLLVVVTGSVLAAALLRRRSA